jgi:hypothetical protein
LFNNNKILFYNKFIKMKKLKLYNIYFYVSFLFFLIIRSILNPKSTINLPLEYPKSTEIVNQYLDSTSTLVNTKILSLSMNNPNLFQRLVAPSDFFFDSIFGLWVIALVVISLFYFKNYNFLTDGFTMKAVKGFNALLLATVIIFVLHLLRDQWFGYLVKQTTSGKYYMKYHFFLLFPEVYVILLLRGLKKVFKKGYEIDQEQKLTI